MTSNKEKSDTSKQQAVKEADDEFDATWDNLSSRRRCESKHRPHKVIRFRNLDKK